MRIALVSQEYPPETAKGGVGSQTYLKAHGLVQRGHQVHVISQMPRATPGRFIKYSWDDGVQVTRTMGFVERMPLWTEAATWLTYSAEVAVSLAELHAHAPLDLIEFPEWGGEGYIHLLNQNEFHHIPSVIHLHGPMAMFGHALGWPELDSEFYRVGVEMEKTCLRLADAVFSSSQCSIDWCRKHYDLPHQNVPVIHTGVDTHLFSPQSGSEEARPTVVFVGRIAPNKGVELLLEACMRLLPEVPELQLRLIGTGNAEVVRRLTQKAPPGLLDMPGFIAGPQLAREFRRAHVFAAPSVYEGGPGFVYLEAMACGLPAIGCSGSGVTEIIEQDVNGLLVPPNDVEALVAALRAVLLDPDKRHRLGAAAREFVLQNAERESCLDMIEQFFRSVVERLK